MLDSLSPGWSKPRGYRWKVSGMLRSYTDNRALGLGISEPPSLWDSGTARSQALFLIKSFIMLIQQWQKQHKAYDILLRLNKNAIKNVTYLLSCLGLFRGEQKPSFR